jgi:hypothetical protein
MRMMDALRQQITFTEGKIEAYSDVLYDDFCMRVESAEKTEELDTGVSEEIKDGE